MTIRDQAKALHVRAKGASKGLAIRNPTAIIKIPAERIDGTIREATRDA
jgi:hypothetical protein